MGKSRYDDDNDKVLVHYSKKRMNEPSQDILNKNMKAKNSFGSLLCFCTFLFITTISQQQLHVAGERASSEGESCFAIFRMKHVYGVFKPEYCGNNLKHKMYDSFHRK